MKTVACIGFAEALSAPEVAWSLVDAGYQVVAFARKGHRSALRHSRFVQCIEVTPPETDSAAARAELERLLDSVNTGGQRGALMPLDDPSVWLCNKLQLKPTWVLAGPEGPAAALALNKFAQVEAARSSGLLVPKTTLATQPQDVYFRERELPLVLKPAFAVVEKDGRLQRGRHWICADRSELDHAVQEWKGAHPLLVQPFVQGIGEGVFGFAAGQEVMGISGHRRLRMMNPHGSGSSACISQPVDASLRRAVEEFARRSNWRGLFMVELLRDSEGNAWFIEFNGRSWGSMALSRRRGLEYPRWTAQQALQPEWRPENCQEPAGQTVCRNAGRELMHLLFVLRGPRSKAIALWPSFWRTLLDVLRIGRGDSFYNWRADDWRVFASDWWCTVRSQLFKSRN